MSDIYLLYIGKDQGTIYGVPARNLTEEEANIHGEQRLIASGLYKLAKSKPYKQTRRQRLEKENNND